MFTTFTELLPPQTSSHRNAINWTPGTKPGTGLLLVHTARSSVEYLVVEFSTPWDGRAFHMAKTSGGTDREETGYDVFCGRNGQDRQCSCKGFAYGRGKPCKHIAAVSALLDNEALWNRTDLVNPEQDAGDIEPPF